MNKDTDKTIVFTDGSSRGNPGPGGWGAVLVLPSRYGSKQEDTDLKNQKVVELGGREDNTTNNRMELTAAIKSLSHIKLYEPGEMSVSVVVYTDSSYLIKGVTRWVSIWQKNQWLTKAKKPVANQDLWEQISSLNECLNIDWRHVAGHAGISGNERADEIATVFADEGRINLERTSLSDYPVNLLEVTRDGKKVEQNKGRSGSSRAKAYSYVSMVNGEIKTHPSWEECKKQVYGKNAKFRKALSKDHEKEIIEGLRRQRE